MKGHQTRPTLQHSSVVVWLLQSVCSHSHRSRQTGLSSLEYQLDNSPVVTEPLHTPLPDLQLLNTWASHHFPARLHSVRSAHGSDLRCPARQTVHPYPHEHHLPATVQLFHLHGVHSPHSSDLCYSARQTVQPYPHEHHLPATVQLFHLHSVRSAHSSDLCYSARQTVQPYPHEHHLPATVQLLHLHSIHSAQQFLTAWSSQDHHHFLHPEHTVMKTRLEYKHLVCSHLRQTTKEHTQAEKRQTR